MGRQIKRVGQANRKKSDKARTKSAPPMPDWKCIYCQIAVKGGATHKCNK